MRNLLAMASILLVLSACNDKTTMSNDKIIEEVKKCEAAGLSARIIHRFHIDSYMDDATRSDMGVVRVDCETKP